MNILLQQQTIHSRSKTRPKKHELEEGWIEKGRRATLEVSSLKAVKASVPWFAACWEGAPQTSNY